MGVFFTTNTPALTTAAFTDHLSNAFQAQSMTKAQADERAKAVVAGAQADTPAKQFQPLRFVLAALVFIAVFVAGIVSEINNLNGASGAAFGFAGTIFGVVSTLISGEAKE